MCEVQKGLYSLQKAWLRSEFNFGKLPVFPWIYQLTSSFVLVLFVSCSMWTVWFKIHIFANSLQTEKSCEVKGLDSILLEPLQIFFWQSDFFVVKALFSPRAHISRVSWLTEANALWRISLSWWELSILGTMWKQCETWEFPKVSLSLKFFAWLDSHSQLLAKSAGVFPLSSAYFRVHLHTLGWKWKS